MINFIKRIVGGSATHQSGCCGVEIKEAPANENEAVSNACCSTDTASSCASSCCSTDTTANSASCCG